MKKILALLLLLPPGALFGQGCIPVRNLVGFGQFAKPEYDPLNLQPTKWLFNVNSRYYKSFQIFDGTSKVYEAPEDRKVNNTFVINFSLTRMLEKGWSYAIDVPIVAANRTSWQEHNPKTKVRQTTSTFGLGDIRITLYKWLWDVSMSHRGNVQLGLGIKLPTGDYRYQDYFYKATGPVLAPVNPTIQLGDGGTGITIEANTFYTVNKTITLYGNIFYLLNPRDQNGVSNATGGSPQVPGHPTIPVGTIKKATADINSVPDAYTMRAGANFSFKDFTFWAGVRLEGQPVHDLIGSSNGQRRAGNIVSVEPGLNYQLKQTILYVFVPIPVYRATKQTVPDKRISNSMNDYVSSPGGFANYLIFAGAVFKF